MVDAPNGAPAAAQAPAAPATPATARQPERAPATQQPAARAGDAQSPERVSDADYEKMTGGERRVYAEQFEQPGHDQDRKPAGDEPAPKLTKSEDGELFKFGGDLELSEREIRDLAALKAHQDLVRAQHPTPDSYKLDLPKDFVPPPGVEYSIDANSDAARHARTWAHKNGISQDAFSELMGVYASTKVEEVAMLDEARKAERDALGAAGTARITALNRILDAQGCADLKPMMVTARIVAALEKLAGKAIGVSRGGPGGRHADDEQDTSPTDEQWKAMSFSERRDYSERASAKGDRR